MTKYTNPMIIQKDTAPYLYLTEYSGIYLNEYDQAGINRGIEIPINPNAQSKYNTVSFQMWIRYPKDQFSASAMPVLDIYGQSFSYSFYINVETGGKRAVLKTDANVEFYQNGIKTNAPIIYPYEWNSIYIKFIEPLSFADYNGRIVLNRGFVFNNLSEYIYENDISQVSRYYPLVWQNVYITNLLTPAPNTWQDMLDMGTWEDASYGSEFVLDYSITGEYIYNDQTGTSIVVVEDPSQVKFYSVGTDVFTNFEWALIEKNLV